MLQPCRPIHRAPQSSSVRPSQQLHPGTVHRNIHFNQTESPQGRYQLLSLINGLCSPIYVSNDTAGQQNTIDDRPYVKSHATVRYNMHSPWVTTFVELCTVSDVNSLLTSSGCLSDVPNKVRQKRDVYQAWHTDGHVERTKILLAFTSERPRATKNSKLRGFWAPQSAGWAAAHIPAFQS